MAWSMGGLGTLETCRVRWGRRLCRPSVGSSTWFSRWLGDDRDKKPRSFFERAAKAPRREGTPGAKVIQVPKCQCSQDAEVPKSPTCQGGQDAKASWIPRQLHHLGTELPLKPSGALDQGTKLAVDPWKHDACAWCESHGFAGTEAPTMAGTHALHRACHLAAKAAQLPRYPGTQVSRVARSLDGLGASSALEPRSLSRQAGAPCRALDFPPGQGGFPNFSC
jgi:hypothetical protein